MRLILNSIILNNFKSYKGTHTIKNIDSSFTAIVGPNGSGKSNIIDSILFVLGFRAKKMRHQQVTDLIYNDGQREFEAFVELVFNKFRIRRSISLKGSSKYFLNDIETTSTNVIKILMDEGVDMEHNRFLILQGEIESIAMMKPKEGLLEFLEDIIGTSVYKKEIEDEQIECENFVQTKADAQASLNFIKKDFDHLEILKKQNESVVYEKIENLNLQENVLQMKNELLARQQSEAETKKNELEKQIEDLRSTNEETRRIFEIYEDKYQKMKKKLNQKEGAFLQAKREYKKAERQNEVQEETKSKLEKKKNNIISDIKKATKLQEVREKEKEFYLKELAENEEELAILYKTTEKYKEKLRNEQIESTKSNKEYALLKENEEKLIKLLDQKAQQTKKKTELKCKEEELSKIKNEIDQLKEKIKNTVINFNEDEITKKLQEVEKDITLTQKELAKRKRRHDEVTQKKESDIRDQEIVNILKKEFNKIGKSKSTNTCNIIGRLQDIGRVPSKYEIALKAACSKLNHIIVDTTATADKCMEIIKKKNMPRTTLIVLEKIKDIPILEKMTVPYLYELIECDEIYKKVFYFALTDTLICEDLVEAEKLAFGKRRRRVVTLDGKLIEKSGIMTGGKITERVKSYEELERSLSRMEAIRIECQEQMIKVEEFKNLNVYKRRLKEQEEMYMKV